MLESDSMSLLRVENLYTRYPGRPGEPPVQAVTDVSLAIAPGEVLGIVGESGCGKSTLARTLLRLCEVHSGTIHFDDKDITTMSRRELKTIRRDMQVVFQDPYGSLNPRHTVYSIISEPLRVHGVGTVTEQKARVSKLLDLVGLPESAAVRMPHEFSGGQRQRIAIARALALQPKLLIADESVSALDVSIQSQIINLLGDLQKELDLALLFISHDVSVVRHLSNRIAVMYLGHIVETGDTESVMNDPRHPYTQALMSAVPGWGDNAIKRIVLHGELPDPSNPPAGCVFNTRCSFVMPQCLEHRPALQWRIPQNADKLTEASISCNACYQYAPE